MLLEMFLLIIFYELKSIYEFKAYSLAHFICDKILLSVCLGEAGYEVQWYMINCAEFNQQIRNKPPLYVVLF